MEDHRLADQERLETRAHLLFWKLKETMTELERRGLRPELVTHPNGMPDRFGVYPPHATTPAVDAIRVSRVHSR